MARKIKVNKHLHELPSIDEIGGIACVDIYQTIGIMLHLWGLADSESRDGIMAGSCETIDEIPGIHGFGQALLDVGWIEADSDRVWFANRDLMCNPQSNHLWKSIPKDQRRPIPTHIRKEIAPPGTQCVVCGSTKRIQIDHIVPVARGGTDNIKNLQPLCKKCNLSKITKTIDEFMAERGRA